MKVFIAACIATGSKWSRLLSLPLVPPPRPMPCTMLPHAVIPALNSALRGSRPLLLLKPPLVIVPLASKVGSFMFTPFLRMQAANSSSFCSRACTERVVVGASALLLPVAPFSDATCELLLLPPQAARAITRMGRVMAPTRRWRREVRMASTMLRVPVNLLGIVGDLSVRGWRMVERGTMGS